MQALVWRESGQLHLSVADGSALDMNAWATENGMEVIKNSLGNVQILPIMVEYSIQSDAGYSQSQSNL